MFDLFKKKQDILPVKLEKAQKTPVPLITDPEELKKKREELVAMIKSAAEDGKISEVEYANMHTLAVQVGISDQGIEQMVRDEFREQLKHQIAIFAVDCVVDETELRAIMGRAKEIGLTKADMDMLINEALSAQREVIAQERKKQAQINALEQKLKEEKAAETFRKYANAAILTTFAAVGVAGAVLFEMARKGKLQGEFSVKHTTVQHTK